MTRLLQLGLLLTLASPASAQSDFPGSQPKTIKIRAMDGKSGKPLARQRLVVFGGDSQKAVRFQQTAFDITTDNEGIGMLKLSSEKISWIQVWVDFMTRCQSDANAHSYSVVTILATGVTAPNTCGSLVQAETPGVFTVYARESTLREKMAR